MHNLRFVLFCFLVDVHDSFVINRVHAESAHCGIAKEQFDGCVLVARLVRKENVKGANVVWVDTLGLVEGDEELGVLEEGR